MSYFNREAIVERRQPQLYWSAIFAGAAISVGVWVVLQVWGVGIGLRAVDPQRADALQRIGVGTGAWSLISPIIAMFVGGLFAGWLAHTREKSVGAAHGFVVWALSSLLGFVTTLWTVSLLATGGNSGGAANEAAVARHIGGALMWIGGSLVVSFITAILGGMLGARRADRVVPPQTGQRVTSVTPVTEPDV
jgi:hypothetical protein